MAASAKAQQAMNNQQLAEQKKADAKLVENKQQVEGQKLDKQTQHAATPNDFIYYSLTSILFLIGCGAAWQTRNRKHNRNQLFTLTKNS